MGIFNGQESSMFNKNPKVLDRSETGGKKTTQNINKSLSKTLFTHGL